MAPWGWVRGPWYPTLRVFSDAEHLGSFVHQNRVFEKRLITSLLCDDGSQMAVNYSAFSFGGMIKITFE